jgi:acetyltransferase-like isoleucine patch superfamily enzyme
MNNFTILQKLRNKIKVIGQNNIIKLSNNKKVKFVKNNIYIKGNNNQLHLRNNINIRNTEIEIIGNNCEITIDDNTIIGYNSYLSAKGEKVTIKIGKNCMLSRNAKLMTSDGHPIYNTENAIINQPKDIILNQSVWIADNVTILKGVTINMNSIVGINSTVTKSISNNSIWAGNPAKIVKENIHWEH